MGVRVSSGKPASRFPRVVAASTAALAMMPLFAPTSFAATSGVSWSAKNIYFASYEAKGISSYTEHGTTYMPVWYVLQALKQSGYTYSFNGQTLNITPPSGVTADTEGLTVGTGNLSIEVNGQLIKKVQTEVRRDGGYGQSTQYIPIYYIQQILSALSFYNAWDGTSWTGQPVAATLSGNDFVKQGAMDAFALVLRDNNEHVIVPNGSVSWSVSGYGQASIDKNTGIFTASTPGTYEVTASVDGFHMTKQVDVYGAPVGVSLSTSPSSVMTDGSSTKSITVKAVDAEGNVVKDFTGQVTVSIPYAGGQFVGGISNGSYDQVVVSLYNGVGTAALTAPSYVPASYETVTSSNLTSSSESLPDSPYYGSVNVSYTAPVVSAIQLTPDTSNVYAGSNNIVNLDVGLTDQSGNPVGSSVGSPVYVTFTISGPASFAYGQTQTTLSENIYPGSNTSIPIYAVDGQQGTVTVTATGDGVSGSTTFNSNSTGLVRSVQTTKTTGTLASAFTVDTLSPTKSATLPAGTPYTIYTVQMVDGNGNPVPEAHTLWLSDSTFVSGSSANGGVNQDGLSFYSVLGNQPDTKLATVTSGTYSVTTSAATGRAQFIVFNTGNVSTASISIKDSSTGLTSTAYFGN